jgi:hypothetical protein
VSTNEDDISDTHALFPVVLVEIPTEVIASTQRLQSQADSGAKEAKMAVAGIASKLPLECNRSLGNCLARLVLFVQSPWSVLSL